LAPGTEIVTGGYLLLIKVMGSHADIWPVCSV